MKNRYCEFEQDPMLRFFSRMKRRHFLLFLIALRSIIFQEILRISHVIETKVIIPRQTSNNTLLYTGPCVWYTGQIGVPQRPYLFCPT